MKSRCVHNLNRSIEEFKLIFSFFFLQHVEMNPPSKLDPVKNPYDQYGVGAESKMRLGEGIESNKVYKAMPIPEGRMRSSEASRYSSSLEANTTYARVPITKRETSKFNTPNGSLKAVSDRLSKLATTEKQNVAQPKNPFDEGDDVNDDYDESKNPFAEDESVLKQQKSKEQTEPNKVLNPFEEYDNNLNPFA